MKKILSLVLAMLMIFSVVPAVFADDAAEAVAEDSAYQEALDFLGAVGFYQGGAGVADDDAITRWQMALFVSRLVTGEVDNSYWATTENDSGFTDVDALEGYMLGAVTFAAQEGIINGYGDGTFGPNDGITYRDALVMTVRALGTKYSASGYPWSYIATARELGLMNGITGIGWTDEITREVVAQILYNAFFADVKGTNVAEKVFNIGSDVVMVTASNRVVYEAGAQKVNATGYVQISAVDGELEPVGTKYHVAGEALGLADANAQNGAVGTLYTVWYRNNYNTIVLYEDLNTLYTNRPDAQQVAVSSSAGKIVINDVTLKTVNNFTNLFNQNRPDSTADGLAEIKLFGIGAASVSGSVLTFGDDYVMYPDGWIYLIEDLTPVGYYSEYLGTWYTYNADDKTYAIMATTDPIYEDLHAAGNGTAGFGSISPSAFSVYADVLASDVDQDGVADRAIVKNYSIGHYTETAFAYGTCTVCSKAAAHTHFTIMTSGPWVNEKTNYGDLNEFGTAAISNAIKEDYNIVGGKIANDTYFVYYLDSVNKELDILKTIPKKSANTTDTYWSYGYVLGFFQTQNKIYVDDGSARLPLDLGYSEMYNFGAPLFSFDYAPSTAASVPYRNNSYLVAELLDFVENEKYVKYLVLDNKVIYIEDAEDNNGDYVIIDSYAEISADGIKVNAWSTVTDQYDVINIAEFNGWDIEGVEWDALWQAALREAFLTGSMPNMSALLAKYVPIAFGQVYAVVSADAEKNYNITLPRTSQDVDVVVAGGFVHSKTDNTLNYVEIDNLATGMTVLETAATDFWLVKELKADGTYKVYGRTGKLANVVFGDGAQGGDDVKVYKADAKSRDFVIEGTTQALAGFLAQINSVDSSKLRYAVYERLSLMQSEEDFEFTPGSYFRQTFRDVVTGEKFLVSFNTADEVDLLNAVKANAVNTIYEIADGELTYNVDETTGAVAPVVATMADVANYVKASNAYTYYVPYVATGSTNLTNLLADAVSALEIDVFAATGVTIDKAQADAYDYIDESNVTFIFLDSLDNFQYGIRYTGSVLEKPASGNANYAGTIENRTLANATAHIFYNKASSTSNTTAVVYVEYDA